LLKGRGAYFFGEQSARSILAYAREAYAQVTSSRLYTHAKGPTQWNETPEEKFKRLADIAESIIEALLPDDEDDRRDVVNDCFQLHSDIETFEELTGKSILPEPLEEDDEDEDYLDEGSGHYCCSDCPCAD
jgi:hypothetical protein